MRTKILLVAALGVFGSVSVQAKNNCEPGQPCQQQTPSARQSQSESMDHVKQQNKQHPSQSQSSTRQKQTPNNGHQNYSQAKQNNNKHHTSQSAPQAKGMYVVKANNLNIRNEPGHSGKVHGKFKGGQEVQVFDIIDGWAKILFNGQYQWVSAQYLQQSNR